MEPRKYGDRKACVVLALAPFLKVIAIASAVGVECFAILARQVRQIIAPKQGEGHQLLARSGLTFQFECCRLGPFLRKGSWTA
jgi:hypothetical protein